MLIKGESVRVGEGHPTSGKREKDGRTESQASLKCMEGMCTEPEITWNGCSISL